MPVAKKSLQTERVIAFYPHLVPLTGSHAAAVVLSQIMYWHQGKLRVPRRGMSWLVKSRVDMCAETGITLDQYKRIMPLLVAQGWIVTERGLFKNRVTPYIRLTDAGWAKMSGLVEPASNRLVAKPAIQLVARDTNPLVAYDANLLTENTTESTTQTGGEDPASRAGRGSTKTPKTCGEEGDEGVEGVEGVEEVEPIDHILSEVAGFGSCMVEPDSATMTEPDMRAEDILKRRRPPSEKAALPAVWLRAVAEHFGGFQKPLTAKERGQLTHLSKALGDRTRAVIEGTVAKWGKFALRVEQARGTSSPNVPTIGFLLKHFDVAMDLLAEKAPTGASVGTSVQLSAAPMIPTPAPAETPHHLTADELAQMLKELDE